MKLRRPPAPESVSNSCRLASAEAVSSPKAPGLARVLRIRRDGALAAAGAMALLLGACVSDVDPNALASRGGSAGMGATGTGSGGSAGGSAPGGNSAGSAGAAANKYTSDPSFATGARCPDVTQALLTDFTYAAVAIADAGADGGTDAGAPNITGVSFGDFTNTLSGSSFVYPSAGAYPVHSDVTGSNWHMTGSIGDYSGFGIVFVGCSYVDASAYKGVSFSVQGSVPMGNSITLNVGTAADDITHLWLNANPPNPAMPPAMPTPPNAGRCVPTASQYDGSCAAPSHAVPVTTERTTISVLWTDLIGGRPSASVDPKEITNLGWSFPAPAGAGTPNPTSYDVDLTIDDLQFIAP